VLLIADCRLADDLADYLASGQRKVETWLRMHKLASADYSDHHELFVNINTKGRATAFLISNDYLINFMPSKIVQFNQ
jgi:molybdopterin-guanine dinucleotide biosynthesis protein A